MANGLNFTPGPLMKRDEEERVCRCGPRHVPDSTRLGRVSCRLCGLFRPVAIARVMGVPDRPAKLWW